MSRIGYRQRQPHIDPLPQHGRPDHSRTISRKGPQKSNIVRYVNILLMPLLVVLTGLMIFFRRRDEAVAAAVTTEKTEEKS